MEIIINELLRDSKFEFLEVGLSYESLLEHIHHDMDLIDVYGEEDNGFFVQYLGFELYFENKHIRYFKLLFYSEYKFMVKLQNEVIEITKDTKLSDMIELLNKLKIEWYFEQIANKIDLYLMAGKTTQIIYSYEDNTEELVHIYV